MNLRSIFTVPDWKSYITFKVCVLAVGLLVAIPSGIFIFNAIEAIWNKQTDSISKIETATSTDAGVQNVASLCKVPGVSLKTSDVKNLSESIIASKVMGMWLGYYKSGNYCRGLQLQDYKVDNVSINSSNGTQFIAAIAFSVKPIPTALSSWAVGNGSVEGEWVNKKFVFVVVNKEEDLYIMRGMSTGQ